MVKKPNKPVGAGYMTPRKRLELEEYMMEWEGESMQRSNPAEDYRPGLTSQEMMDKIVRDPRRAEREVARQKLIDREIAIMNAEKRMRAEPHNPMPTTSLKQAVVNRFGRSTPKGPRLKKRSK